MFSAFSQNDNESRFFVFNMLFRGAVTTLSGRRVLDYASDVFRALDKPASLTDTEELREAAQTAMKLLDQTSDLPDGETFDLARRSRGAIYCKAISLLRDR